MALTKRALITGINGQDGSYLAESLLAKAYEVHGIVRRSALESKLKLGNIEHMLNRLQLHSATLENHLSIYKVIALVQPDECYHLAASSFVSYDFGDEASIISINFNSTHFLLSCLRELVPQCRFYYAGSSEMFGEAESSPQNERTCFNPRSIYGISKLSSYFAVKNYRERHKFFACTGISYNHESVRRGPEYVTRKIAQGVARIHSGKEESIELGNLDVYRDWGYAPEYVEAMWKMLNAESPHDYVISTGTIHSLGELLEVAFSTVNLDYRKHVRLNERYFRPSENTPLRGDPSLIERNLGWKASKNFAEMIREMVLHECQLIRTQQ